MLFLLLKNPLPDAGLLKGNPGTKGLVNCGFCGCGFVGCWLIFWLLLPKGNPGLKVLGELGELKGNPPPPPCGEQKGKFAQN